jgi:hypothetical protein
MGPYILLQAVSAVYKNASGSPEQLSNSLPEHTVSYPTYKIEVT